MSISKDESINGEYELPTNIELEFVETTPVVDEEINEETQQEEFFFPLFATDPESKTANTEENAEDKLMKVTLKEEDDIPMIQSRPTNYYFAEYTKKQSSQFEESAIEFDDIFKTNYDNRYLKKPVLNLNEYNKQVELETLRSKKKSRMRPSQKLRKSKILTRKNIKDRKKLEKKLEQQKKSVFQKKKRGGKKNKKKSQLVNTTKPVKKYRTE